MSHVKNVIQTSDVFASALNHLNRDSVIDLVQQVMTISEAANQDLSADLNGKITTVRSDLQSAINVLSVKTDQAMAAAKILEGAEIDQLVSAFRKFIETTGMQEIIQDAAVKIGPTSYTLRSVIQTLALADKDAKVEILHNAGGTEIIGVRYTLVDGYSVTLNASVTVDDGGVSRYTFVTDNWRGLTASYYCEYRRSASQLAFFGRSLSSVRFLPVSHTNLVFDICNKFTILNPLTTADVLPDLSGIAPSAKPSGSADGSGARAAAGSEAAAGASDDKGASGK